MELSDYDILEVTPQATFNTVKNAYYDLSRIYHPDSTQIIASLTKEDRVIAFKRINEAYENIKKKLNIVEVDLPKLEVEYIVPIIERNKNFESITQIDFNEKFNKEFEKMYKMENLDNPYSIYYCEPEKSKRNLNESLLIIREYNYNNHNFYEFGINYIHDHSTNKYTDIRFTTTTTITTTEKIKDLPDSELETKLESLIKSREEKIEIKKEDIEFMEKQNSIRQQIQNTKDRIHEERNVFLLY